MDHHPWAQCIVVLLCLLFPLSFAECGSSEGAAPPYPFDFADLSDEWIRRNYEKVNYNIHQNKLFNFSILKHMNWDAVKVAEPPQLPLDGALVEIGLFNLYSPNHDPQGDIKAQLIIYIAGVPKEISAADYLDKQVPLILRAHEFKTVQSKSKDTALGPTKDILISYGSNNTPFMSRFCAFKVEDRTKVYLFGETHLLYMIHMTTHEDDYKLCSEAFYLSKVTFHPY